MEEYGKATHITREGFEQALKDTCMTEEEFKEYCAAVCNKIAVEHIRPIVNEIDAMKKTLENVNPYVIARCGLNVVVHIELVGEDVCTVALGNLKTSLCKIMGAAIKVEPNILKGESNG